MTNEQEKQLIALLWDSMKRDREHRDRVLTGWGTKTQVGLIACITRIMEEKASDLVVVRE